MSNLHYSEEDDDDDWVPMDAQTTATATEVHTSESGNQQDTIDFNNTVTANSMSNRNSSSTSNNGGRRTSTDSTDKLNNTLKTIRKRHERNEEIKQNFVNRPLILFPKLFFYHLITEFWNSNRTIRVGE